MPKTVNSNGEFPLKREISVKQPEAAPPHDELTVTAASGTIFLISLTGIVVELCLAALIGLKTWSHMVYLVLSFALLGYGAGTICFRLLDERKKLRSSRRTALGCIVLLALVLFACAEAFPPIPLNLPMLSTISGIGQLVLVALLLALPFVVIGFVTTQILSLHRQRAGFLYGLDLLGAGGGAAVFFVAIHTCGPWRAIVFSSAVLLIAAAFLVGVAQPHGNRIRVLLLCSGFVFGWVAKVPEPVYAVDRTFHWEWIPCFGPAQREVLKKWTPLGRTDLYEILPNPALEGLFRANWGTFQINLQPLPRMRYFVNNFRAGTPVYELSERGLERESSRVVLFSRAMELPYTLVDKPNVYIIGVGGGRDVFMALTHGARSVTGAELNPVTWSAMQPGGVAHEYSGGLYTRPGVTVRNIEGRHFTKLQQDGTFDLVILNGVDTFAALASGAYAYSENYLYTKEGLVDYLRVCRNEGIVNLNRIYQADLPRESLRLFVMALDALRSLGVRKPWEHVIMSREGIWGILMMRKTPFTVQERASVFRYIASRGMEVVYADLAGLETVKDLPSVPISSTWTRAQQAEDANDFFRYARALQEGEGSRFIRDYPSDISVVTDDSPFFYKHYRFTLSREPLLAGYSQHCATAFCIQFTILLVAMILCLAVILLPLAFLRSRAAWRPGFREGTILAGYFAAIGLGFMFLEIGVMQKLTLLIGSPIYSISLTLASLLVFSGIGSFLAGRTRTPRRWILFSSVAILLMTLFIFLAGKPLVEWAIGFPFAVRAFLAILTLLPLGIALGGFLPIGLTELGAASPSAVAWALGVNFSCSVAGSILAIIIAQFTGFQTVFFLAAGLYLGAAVSLWVGAHSPVLSG